MSDVREIPCTNYSCQSRNMAEDTSCTGTIVCDMSSLPANRYYAKLENSTTPRGTCDRTEALNNQAVIIDGNTDIKSIVSKLQ